ncbi:MAG: PAS domain S-box protein [Candidatus Hodarchaeota archaeon]
MISKDIFEKKFIMDVINASQDTIFVFNPQTGQAIIWNKAFSEVSGYSDNEIKSLKAPDSYYSKEDLKKAKFALQRILEKGKTTLELTLITKDGSKISYEYSGTSFQDPDGNVLIVSVGRNISERKEIERKLRESEEKYRSLFENMNAGFAYHEVLVDEKNKPIDYKYIEVNPKFEELTGLKKENLIGKKVTEAIPGTEKDPADWIGRFGNVGLTGIPLIVEDYSEAIQKWFKVSGYSPRKGFFAVTFTDITDMKIAEQKLRESEEKFRNITEQSLVGISVIQNGQFKYLNERVGEINGYPTDEIKNWAPNEFAKIIHPEDREFVMEQARKKQVGETDIVNQYQFRIIKKNGDIRWLEIFSKTINYEGSPADLVMTIDITDKVKAEINLRESEARYRLIAENSNMVVWSTDMNLNFTFISPNCSSILGFIPEEVLSSPISIRLTPESMKTVVKVFREELKIEKSKLKDVNRSRTFQTEQIHKNGKIIPVEIIFTFLRDINDKAIGIIGVSQDITERKKAEQELKDSEEKYRKLFDNAPFSILLFNTEGFILDCNSQTETITGYSKEELLGKNFKDFNFYVDMTSANLDERTKQVSSGIIPKPRELLLYKKDGGQFWARSHIEFVNMQGVTFIQAIIHDITEQKQALFKLNESHEKLKELEKIINSSPGVVFLWKNSEGWPVEFVSENIKQFGFMQEDFYSGKVRYSQIIHPDDLERVAEEVNIYSNEDVSEFEQEYRIITKDGKIKWLDDRTWIRRDSEGNITHYQGIVLDITERKKTEEALKKSERDYKEAYEVANFYKDLFTHDMNNILQIINSSTELISYQLVDSEKSKYIGNMTDMIKNQIERGSKLISNVRTLSELEEEEVATYQIEIIAFLENSINFIKKAYSEKQMKITFNKQEGGIHIIANDLLQDVFENILINAIKYNENHEVDIIIKISEIQINTKNYIKMEFIDNGIGVADNRKDVIFKRGQRELKGSKGMGLGLSLVSIILRIFKGKIWVEDRVKGDYTKGSNFIILLPIAN